ncbi:hypothetical protein GGR57DRAFT_499398 [Xylariaceae sp. FL1272]|nr:hypothetical protein GGR57DRAFT_499398 [Xylariaceae sp. FL1272]
MALHHYPISAPTIAPGMVDWRYYLSHKKGFPRQIAVYASAEHPMAFLRSFAAYREVQVWTRGLSFDSFTVFPWEEYDPVTAYDAGVLLQALYLNQTIESEQLDSMDEGLNLWVKGVHRRFDKCTADLLFKAMYLGFKDLSQIWRLINAIEGWEEERAFPTHSDGVFGPETSLYAESTSRWNALASPSDKLPVNVDGMPEGVRSFFESIDTNDVRENHVWVKMLSAKHIEQLEEFENIYADALSGMTPSAELRKLELETL